MNNNTRSDRVRFFFDNAILGRKLVTESINFKDSLPKLTRLSTHGFSQSFETGGEFILDAKDYLVNVYTNQGIGAVVEVIREDKHPQLDIWQTYFVAEVDFTSYEEEGSYVKCNITKGGAEKKLKNLESEKVELERRNSLDGESIDILNVDSVRLPSRGLRLQSNFQNTRPNTIVSTNVTFSGFGYGMHFVLPIQTVNNGITEVSDVIEDNSNIILIRDREKRLETSDNDTEAPTIITLFKAETRKNITIDFDINFSSSAVFTRINTPVNRGGQPFNAVANARVEVSFTIMEVDEEFNHVRNWYNSTKKGSQNEFIALTNKRRITLDLPEGHSLLLRETISTESDRNIFVKRIETKRRMLDPFRLQIIEDSVGDETRSNCITLFEATKHLTEILLGINYGFKSNFLRLDDLARDTVLLHGFWARQFNRRDDRYKPIEISHKELLSSIDSIFNTGAGFEFINGKETLVVEDFNYFYRDFVSLKLPNVSNVTRKPDTDLYYSSLVFGYKKGGQYNESIGLEEYNTKSTYLTPSPINDKIYDKESDFRADAIGLEFAKRKPKNLFGSEDTTYDNDVFVLACERRGFSYAPRAWQTDYTEQPQGVDNIDSSYNFILSPLQNLKRHANNFRSSLFFDRLKNLVYSSGNSANKITTTLGNEREDVVIDDLSKSKVFAEIVTFEFPLPTQDFLKLQNKGTIEGREEYPLYGKVEFRTERGLESGWILEIEQKEITTFTILKSL